MLHASRLRSPDRDGEQIAVIIEPATPSEVAAVIMQAYGLTERERAVTGLLCTGRSTAQITAELWISPNTLQDHLKSIFDKTGVRSRREVMATILRDHYLPGAVRSSAPSGKRSPTSDLSSEYTMRPVASQTLIRTIWRPITCWRTTWSSWS